MHFFSSSFYLHLFSGPCICFQIFGFKALVEVHLKKINSMGLLIWQDSKGVELSLKGWKSVPSPE
jgi:hypothetical protein